MDQVQNFTTVPRYLCVTITRPTLPLSWLCRRREHCRLGSEVMAGPAVLIHAIYHIDANPLGMVVAPINTIRIGDIDEGVVHDHDSG